MLSLLSETTNPHRLCVLVTCLGCGLRPLLIIRITAALSSNKWSWVECELLEMLGSTWSMDSKHELSNVSETEWLFRVCDAQGSPWLFCKTMFPTRTPKIEEMVNHPYVNLRLAKQFQTRHYCEKLRFPFGTSTKWEQTCVIQMRTINLLNVFLNPACHLKRKHLGISQVCSIQLDFPTWQNCL